MPPSSLRGWSVRAVLDQLVSAGLERLATEFPPGLLDVDPQLERTRDPRNGDFATNVALRLAKIVKCPPREFAQRLIDVLPDCDQVAAIQVAGPGFINFTLSNAAFNNEVIKILTDGPRYGHSDIGQGQRVLVEYVSANPTGPLHVGHGRHAAYGACVASLLKATGHQVEQEYYVNDAGRQMDILAVSVWFRYAEQLGVNHELPENAYQGDYVREIAAGLVLHQGDGLLVDLALTAAVDPEAELDMAIVELKEKLGDGFNTVLDAALNSVLIDIKEDLHQFNIHPDNWFSERSLTTSGSIQTALDQLQRRAMTYERDGAVWFRSSDFADEKDRVVVRENGNTTYFASDIAYHYQKRQRGFELLLDVLGSDHHGYVARVRAGLEAMGEPGDALEVRLVQFVVLYRGSEKVQMSTRSGNYVTLRELREEVGNDAARLFYVMRSNDQHLDFDLELAKSQSNDNPVYYIQYAHARVASMMQRLAETGVSFDRSQAASCLDALSEPAERALMTALSRYPEVLELAASSRSPQHLAHYLRDVAADFHTYYNAHRVLVDDDRLRTARVALALATQQVVRNGLGLLGVSAPEKM
jgi:arginyl-tRNA synthetase